MSLSRPHVLLKLATSLDGRIATASGESKWISGPQSRRYAHVLRSRYDAIAVGVGTVIADDPELSCRLPDWTGGQPLRLVFDTHLRTPTCACLVRTADKTPGWIMTSEQAPKERKQVLEQAGIRVVEQPLNAQKTVDLVSSLIWLKQQGLDSLMVEGGGALAASFIRAGCIDELAWFRAPLLLGGDGIPAPGPLFLENLKDAPHFILTETKRTGEDMYEHYTVKKD